MKTSGPLYLGLHYLGRHRAKTFLLVAAITLSLILPLAVTQTVQLAETHLRTRAESTPLVLGARGSELELAFNGLYFEKPEVATLPIGTARNASRDGLCTVIPLHAQFRAREHRIVGTSIDYLNFRGIPIAEGQLFYRLGQCVIGAEMARNLDLGPGDHILSTSETLFDLAGVYPLKMQITGVLAPTGGPDDHVLFTDVKTTWIIAGLSHGHQEAEELDADQVLEESEEGARKLNASVKEYNEITPENAHTFHFHGDPDTFPITSAILVPIDQRAETILLGRYQDDQAPTRLIRPRTVMDDLFDTVFQIRDVVLAALLLVALSSVAIAVLVFALSNRLRHREFRNLDHLGADRAAVRFLVFFETGFVVCSAVSLSALAILFLRSSANFWLPLLTN